MFGHQDPDQQNDQNAPAEPMADATLAHDGAHEPDASAPSVSDDAPGDYIMTEPHQQGAPTPSAHEPADPTTVPAHSADDDLLEMKQKALQQLTPLVGHLDQSPEEKFRTTMMMIQASDDQALLKVAYEAAQAITDEKARAQALLDVVNEINYFTQHTEE